MASGSIDMSSGKGWKGRIDWSSEANQSKNQSTVYASVTTWKTDGYNTSNAVDGFKGKLIVDGNEKSFSYTQENKSGQSWRADISVTVDHESSGEGSCSIYAYVNGASGTSLSGVKLEGGDTVELDKIARGAHITGAKNTTLGEYCNVSWWSGSSSLSYKLEFSIGTWSHTTGMIYPNVSSDYTYTGYLIPIDVADSLPNQTSGTMTVVLYTYPSGSSYPTGSSQTTFTVTVPSNIKPTVDSVSVAIDNSGNSVVAGWGVALAGYSKIRVTATASGTHKSTIKSFAMTGSDVASIPSSQFDYTTGLIMSSGDKVFKITCTDSRGRVSIEKTSQTITVLPYSKPIVTYFKVSKNAQSKMQALAEWDFDSVGGHNSTSAIVQYKKSTASSWTVYGNISKGIPLVMNIAMSDMDSYNFRIIVTDALSQTAQKDAFSSTTLVLLDFKAGGKGLGVGKICETDSMEVAFDAKFYNDIYIGTTILDDYIKQVVSQQYIRNNVFPVGAIYMSLSNTSPASIFGGTWEALKDRFLLGAGGVYPVNSTGGETSHKLTVNEMPSHIHNFKRVSVNYPTGLRWEDMWGYYQEVPDEPTPSWYDNNISSVGGSATHNNMPPYLTVYMWKRIS